MSLIWAINYFNKLEKLEFNPIKMKSLLVFSLGLLLILLQSCEGNTQREWTVFNETNQSITIISNSNFTDLETFIIPPKSSKIVAINDLRGGQKEPGETNLHFDNLDLIRPSDSTSVDLKNNSKWEVQSVQLHRVPSEYEHKFSLHINDSYL